MAGYDVVEASIADLAAAMAAGEATSEGLVEAYRARIAAVDQAGPALRSVISLGPRAADAARAMDAERRAGRLRGPLHGVPLLVKDNIETADGTATTAGSLALQGNVTGRDAPLVRRLQGAGAVILGKTNLSEWANFRSAHSISGWSAIGGLVKNPYALDRSASGSSAAPARRSPRRWRRPASAPRPTARSPRRPRSAAGRAEADARPDLARPRRADLPQPGHRRADGAQRGGCGAAADRDGRRRPGRSRHAEATGRAPTTRPPSPAPR